MKKYSRKSIFPQPTPNFITLLFSTGYFDFKRIIRNLSGHIFSFMSFNSIAD